MFKNKLLKQLQEVQAKIRKCEEAINQLNMPVPVESCVQFNSYSLLHAIISGDSRDMDKYQLTKSRKYEDETYEYLQKLGQYLIDIVAHRQQQFELNDELKQLKHEEKYLKTQLGIT
jgi:hypothetical protein